MHALDHGEHQTPLELKLHMILSPHVCVLRTELVSSERATSAHNPQATSPATVQGSLTPHNPDFWGELLSESANCILLVTKVRPKGTNKSTPQMSSGD